MTEADLTSRRYIGIDVGGTNIKVGIVDDAGNTLGYSKVPTLVPDGLDAGLKNIDRAVGEVLEQAELKIDDIHAIGVATPGTMDIPAGFIILPPNLPTWAKTPIRDIISERFGRPAILQNDANAAAYGEYWVGRGKESNILLFWTLGTGIGSGLIINGHIIEGAHSHGGECGHIIIEMHNGRLCGTGQYGTLEAYTGAWALVKRCQEALETNPNSLIRKKMADSQLTPLLIKEAAEEGDSLANELIMDTAMYLGIGTTTILHTIDPDMVLFGGAMTFGRNETEIGRRFLERIKEEVDHRAFPVPAQNTIIDYAELGSNAGYIGAAGCARQAFGSQ